MEHDTGPAAASPAAAEAEPDTDRAERDTGRAEPDTGRAEPDPGRMAPDAGWTEPDTGEARVDAALRGLSEIGDLHVAEHPQVFERIHASLVEVLGELHSGPDADPSARSRQAG